MHSPGCSTALNLLSRCDRRLSSSSRIVAAKFSSGEIERVVLVVDRSTFELDTTQVCDTSGRDLAPSTIVVKVNNRILVRDMVMLEKLKA